MFIKECELCVALVTTLHTMVWKRSTPVPHFSTLPHIVENITIPQYSLIINTLRFYTYFWHGHCNIISERRNGQEILTTEKMIRTTEKSTLRKEKNPKRSSTREQEYYKQFKNLKDMKKLFFAAIAAIVMVSVSNVFANNAMTVSNNSAVADSTVVDPTDSTEAPVEAPAEEQKDSAKEVAPGADDTALVIYSDSTEVDSTDTDSTQNDTTTPAAPQVA